MQAAIIINCLNETLRTYQKLQIASTKLKKNLIDEI